MAGSTTIIVVALCALGIASAAGLEFEVVRDEEGQEFALVPVQGDTLLLDPSQHSRVRRQTNRNVFGNVLPGPNGGTQLSAGASGNLLNRNGHTLNGNAQWSREYKIPNYGTGPSTVAGGLQYRNDRVHANVNAAHTRGFGTGVDAQAGVNLWRSQDRRGSLDLNGQYSRHFGGPGPRMPTQYGGLLNFRYNLP